jgi:predicted permease
MSRLDFKLGFRMLAKYPGLTLVGGLAIAFAIWIGAATFELATQVLRPAIPLDDGDRIVGVRLWDAKVSAPEARVARDFAAWRREVKSVQDLGAFRLLQRNLITGEGAGEPIEVAEISASAFRVARVPPMLGRTLVDDDEAEGAPPVVVIGHALWESRFGGDPNIIGRAVRLGRSQRAIVGVMPPGFEFPISQAFWVPLRLNPLDYEGRTGPSLRLFGRLAPDASLEEAQAELTAIGQRTAMDFPTTHEHLRPQVMPYARSIMEISLVEKAALLGLNVPVLLLLVLICGNVALLMFARVATRETEMVVRTALGASRARLIMQLFTEALVLGAIAAVVGLAAAGVGLDWVMRIVEVDMMQGRKLPFWFEGRLSTTTVLYAVGLTLLGAVIAGVVPALKVTRGVGMSLKGASAGSGGMRFGGVWTVIIISQVAVTVAFPAVAFFVKRDSRQIASVDVGFPTQEYLALRLEMDREPPPNAPADTSRATFLARYGQSYAELERRLLAEGAVAGVTYGERLPLMYHPHSLIEVDDGGAAPLNPEWPDGYRVSSVSVDPDFFSVLGAPILAGRPFHSGDFEANAVPVVVNQPFVRLVLGERSPIGRRLRYVTSGGRTRRTIGATFEAAERPLPVEQRGPWFEIVGVVRDMGMATGDDPKVAGIYHPVAPADAYPVQVAVHVKGDPQTFARHLRVLAAEIEPTLRLYDVEPLERERDAAAQGLAFWFQLFMLVSGVALLLSLAGIYAVMSFTVAKRTREIGIRIALGASQRRVLAAIFRRPLMQVALGIVCGAVVVTIMMHGIGGMISVKQGALLVVYAIGMMGVCLLACVVPTRKALQVEPTEALRSEG